MDETKKINEISSILFVPFLNLIAGTCTHDSLYSKKNTLLQTVAAKAWTTSKMGCFNFFFVLKEQKRIKTTPIARHLYYAS